MNGPSRLSPQRLRLGRRRLPVPADVSGHSAEGVGERTAPGKPVEIHGSVLVYSVKDYMAARHQSSTRVLCQSEKAPMLAATSIIDC